MHAPCVYASNSLLSFFFYFDGGGVNNNNNTHSHRFGVFHQFRFNGKCENGNSKFSVEHVRAGNLFPTYISAHYRIESLLLQVIRKPMRAYEGAMCGLARVYELKD